MIKVYNKKPIGEINKLRGKGLYNAPFSLLENVDLSKLKLQTFDDSLLQQRIDDVELSHSEFVVTTYEEMDAIRKKQEQAVIEIYETLLGGF